MIDYSVYMLKNRMDETAELKAYAKAQMRELMTFRSSWITSLPITESSHAERCVV